MVSEGVEKWPTRGSSCACGVCCGRFVFANVSADSLLFAYFGFCQSAFARLDEIYGQHAKHHACMVSVGVEMWKAQGLSWAMWVCTGVRFLRNVSTDSLVFAEFGCCPACFAPLD